MSIEPEVYRELCKEAKRASEQAYAPYSKFRVGAAFSSTEGVIVSGTNIENASYGLAICAERNAIFSGVARGIQTISVMVVYTPTMTPTAPCGACRQVLREFSSDAVVISICDSDERIETSINELLPHSFGSHNLDAK